MSAWTSPVHVWRSIIVALTLAAACACVTITYPRPAHSVSPRAGETLVFGRMRFFHDGSEFFPWEVKLIPTAAALHTERHLWLLRLGRRAVSAELHPDEDGSLAVWLAPADYALLGSLDATPTGLAAFEVVALLRVPGGPISAYVGELSMTTESHEGGYLSSGEFGVKSLELQPVEIARATLEQRLGTLPERPVVSPWCAGEDLPRFGDPDLANRSRRLLDGGCPAAR